MIRPHFPPPPLLEAGWYSDPTGRYEARYWDGQKWTKHVSHYGAVGTDPVLRARFDRLWIRLIIRLVTWGGAIVAVYLLTKAFWPSGFLRESSLMPNISKDQYVITSDSAFFSHIGITIKAVIRL
jgi:hypothetical protein